MKVYEKKWSSIKIGEAFYFHGCEGFGIRISNTKVFILECDNNFYNGKTVLESEKLENCTLYSLPVAMRRAMEVENGIL